MLKPDFAIRTITAGINLGDLSNQDEFKKAVDFLKKAKNVYSDQGHTIQTLRIATQHFHKIARANDYKSSFEWLKRLDEVAREHEIMVSIGQVLPPDHYDNSIVDWGTELIRSTNMISFSLPVSDHRHGILLKSIKAAAETMVAIAHHTRGGEGNFRFAAAANCQPGIPYFPVAYHKGKNSFGVGLEYPDVLTETIAGSAKEDLRRDIKTELEKIMKPVEKTALQLSNEFGLEYLGIDTSTAPGLEASIGESIEAITGQPFGSASTLAASAMITDIIKNIDVKTCGYSGLMLPILEDKILAKRAEEKRFTIQELLLYSAVCGTGLDVVPLPGDTPVEKLEGLLTDIAALSVKYTDKALSARLFLIPGKGPGDLVTFNNPYLTSSRVMSIR